MTRAGGSGGEVVTRDLLIPGFRYRSIRLGDRKLLSPNFPFDKRSRFAPARKFDRCQLFRGRCSSRNWHVILLVFSRLPRVLRPVLIKLGLLRDPVNRNYRAIVRYSKAQRKPFPRTSANCAANNLGRIISPSCLPEHSRILTIFPDFAQASSFIAVVFLPECKSIMKTTCAT